MKTQPKVRNGGNTQLAENAILTVPAEQTPPAPPPNAPLPLQPGCVGTVHIKVVWGSIVNVTTSLAVAGQYEGVALAGPAREFDSQLDSWLSRAFEHGMVSGGLGQLFPLHLKSMREAGRVKVDNLLLVGGGEPGLLGADDLRFLMSNVIIAVIGMSHDDMSIGLIGARRNELSIDRALRAFLEGVRDGFANFRAMLAGVTHEREHFEQAVNQPLKISMVENDQQKAKEILEALQAIENAKEVSGLDLHVDDEMGTVPLNSNSEPSSRDVDPDVPVTLLRVTKKPAITGSAPTSKLASSEIYQFSALSETAVITVRELELNSYFVTNLPGRITTAPTNKEQEAFGVFLTNCLIPDDFRHLVEVSNQLTLVVDDTTACLPWEMAAYRVHTKTGFFGTDLGLTRQFRTLASAAPWSSAPLNHKLKVLVIADPALGLPLPKAREEGRAVIEVMERANRAWEGEFKIEVFARIGSWAAKDEWLDALLAKLRNKNEFSSVASAKACDPMELAMLIVNEGFDLIHFAGHGVYDPAEGVAGWVFDEECVLSAHEIFRVRQVPRLVFANACFSAMTGPSEGEPMHHPSTVHAAHRIKAVGLAQAFFSRGIPNYIGTGWEVDDELAAKCARKFYTQVLGLHGLPTSPPATLGKSLAAARSEIRAAALAETATGNGDMNVRLSTWGAYQLYGRANDKLLPLANRPRFAESG